MLQVYSVKLWTEREEEEGFYKLWCTICICGAAGLRYVFVVLCECTLRNCGVNYEVVVVQEYIVNLWTQDRELSQPWSMRTFQDHINNVTASAPTFDRMWAQMQKIVGKHLPTGTCVVLCCR